MNNAFKIGKRIKKRREELKMTQEELGKLLWLNKSTIQRYETGKITSIKLPVLHAMAKQLNVSPDWLALKTDEMGCFFEQKEWYKDENKNFIDESDNTTFMESLEKDDKKIHLIARHLEQIPEEDRKQLIDTFEKTIDLYLSAKGLKKD